MQENGKILFYNASEGQGIIITVAKHKYEFDVKGWDDYETIPEAGLNVAFDIEGQVAVGITVLSSKRPEVQSGASLDKISPESLVGAEKARPTSIRLSVDIDTAIHDYFNQIEQNVRERTRYQGATGRLDFLRIRRFLFTTYNNLTELDVHFITPEIRVMHSDLVQMGQVYDDYKMKATYPDVAFDKVFLSRQSDYVSIRDDVKLCFEELKRLHVSEQILAATIEEKEQVLKRTLRSSPQYERLDYEHKDLKKSYVDTVHSIASLDAQHKQGARLISAFEKEYRSEFLERFTDASRKYRNQILQILDAQAFLFDAQLWTQAKKSKVIKRFFDDAHIEGDYCAKTYLKYYLNTLNPDIISPEQQELFDLYDYLESLSNDAVLILVQDIDDALRLKYIVSQTKSSPITEAFVDESKAMAWAKDKQANILILEDRLQNASFAGFIKEYKKKVSLVPEVLLLSNEDKSKFPSPMIKQVVRKGFSNSEMSTAIKTLLEKEKDG